MSLPIAELDSIAKAIERALKNEPEQWSRLQNHKEWTVYCDGSAPIVNPGGAIGFAAIFLLDDTTAFEVNGGTAGRHEEPATSNNRAEISGIISILELSLLAHQTTQACPIAVRIICDSQYVLNCAQGHWQKKKNRDLWARFDRLACSCRAKKIKISYQWTKAHVGTKWNERADVLAKEAALVAHRLSDKHPAPGDAANAPGEKTREPSYHYRLRLFSIKKKSQSAEGFYEISTSTLKRHHAIAISSCLSPDEAEYHTLNAALVDLVNTVEQAGRTVATFKVQVVSSRDLMLKQLRGIYSVKSERLIPLHAKSKGLFKKFASIELLEASKEELKYLQD